MWDYIIKEIRRKIIALTPSHRLKAALLRKEGLNIGKNCKLYTTAFGNEPYLITIGDNVQIGFGTRFTNHDGGVTIFKNEYPGLNVFGKISVGDNSFIGVNCSILHDTEIGSNCIIGAGSVVKGKIPDDSVAFGNPAKVILKTSLYKTMALSNKGRIDINVNTEAEKNELVKRHFGII